MAKVAISSKAFERWFKKTVTKPLLERVEDALQGAGTHAVTEAERDALDRIHKSLPAEMYGWITTAEANYLAKGVEKYIGVVNQLANWLMANGYGFAVPLLVPVVETSVRRVYKSSHLESVFDRFHIEDNVEAWLGFKISTNDDDDDAKGGDVPAPARKTATVVKPTPVVDTKIATPPAGTVVK